MCPADHDVLESTIVPILLMDGEDPVEFCGTGFLFPKQVFVTAWHCVERQIKAGQRFIGAPRVAGKFKSWRLADLAQDANGSDLALARVDAEPALPFRLSAEGRLIGHDVWTYGYPLTESRRDHDGLLHFTLHGRVLRGYATRTFDFTHQRFGVVSSYELDMPTPGGLSGAPLLLPGTHEVIGVVYGSHQVQSADAGGEVPERVTIWSVTFGLAHRSKTLRAARGPATQGKALADYLEAP